MGVHQVVVFLQHRAHAGLHSLLPATGVVKTTELPGIHQRNDGFLKGSASRHLVVEGKKIRPIVIAHLHASRISNDRDTTLCPGQYLCEFPTHVPRDS